MYTSSLVSRSCVSTTACALAVGLFLALGVRPAAAQYPVIAQFLDFPVGMAELPDGSLLVAELGASKISRHYPDGTSEDFATDLFDVTDVLVVDGAEFKRGGGRFVVATQPQPDRIVFIDLVTREEVAAIESIGAPYGLAPGLGGVFYVSTVTGEMYRVPQDLIPDRVISGLSGPRGLDMDPPPPLRGEAGDGSLLVAEFGAGRVSRVFPDGTREDFATGLNIVYDIVSLGDGSALVTNEPPFAGEVLRLYPDGTTEVFAEGLNTPRGLLVLSDGRVLASEFNSGIQGRVLEIGQVTVASEAEAMPEGALAVSAPRPNPTRGAVRVRVSVDAPSRVRTGVYDVLGRRVRDAFDGLVTESAEVEVDTGDLAPGLYFLRVSGEQAFEVRRFTVVR